MKQNSPFFMPILSIKINYRRIAIMPWLMITMLQSFSQKVQSVEVFGSKDGVWHFYPGRTSFLKVTLDTIPLPVAQSFVVYVNNIPVRKTYPIGTLSGKTLNYRFDFDKDTQIAVWKDFFHANEGEPKLDKARISVGPESGVPLQPVEINVQLVKENAQAWTWIVGVILLAVFTFALFWTQIFREPTTIPDIVKTKFSLSRVQFGVWNILILFSATFIYLHTAKLLPVPPQLLGLLGISGGQFILGWALAKTSTGEFVAKEPTGTLVGDIGEGLHRFQNLLWSVALWIYFIQALLVNVDYPAIDTNLLILTGFTVGLYAFGKAKETPAEVKKRAKTKIVQS
ncbi:MAG: hypothetical protein ACJ75B_12975 [Flavisolibacter sp.]